MKMLNSNDGAQQQASTSYQRKSQINQLIDEAEKQWDNNKTELLISQKHLKRSLRLSNSKSMGKEKKKLTLDRCEDHVQFPVPVFES